MHPEKMRSLSLFVLGVVLNGLKTPLEATLSNDSIEACNSLIEMVCPNKYYYYYRPNPSENGGIKEEIYILEESKESKE